MVDSAARAEAPRIERTTLWAIALDAVALTGVFAFAADLLVSPTYEDENIFVIYYRYVAPLAAIAALGLSIRSARTAEGPSARVFAWSMVLVSGALLLCWVWGCTNCFPHQGSTYISIRTAAKPVFPLLVKQRAAHHETALQ